MNTAAVVLTGWTGAVTLICMLVSYAARRLAPLEHFFHTAAGAALLALVSAAADSLAQAIPARGLSQATVYVALIGAVASLFSSANPSGRGGGGAAVLLLCALGMGSASCQCWQPQHKNDVGCIVLHQIIDCTTGEIVQLGSPVASVIETYIAGQTSVDWGALEGALEAAGIKDTGCILAQLENDFVKKAPRLLKLAGPEHFEAKASSFHSYFADWKMRHGLTGVRFKLADGSLL